MKRIRVGVLFGGRSAEHEVSLQSARNVIAALDPEKYEPILIGIDKSGHWHLNESSTFLLDSEDPIRIRLPAGQREVLALPWESEAQLLPLQPDLPPIRVDVVFPVLHGPMGEDGTVQGLLRLAGIPFVGAGVCGSAVSMDKDVAKRLLRDAQIDVARWITARHGQMLDPEEVLEELGSPLFIKPANLGSSVGVHRAESPQQVALALEDAFRYDRKVLLEEFISGRELECSVLGNLVASDPPLASLPGEVESRHEFYSYAAKYLDEDGARLHIPAELDSQTTSRVQDVARRAFLALECEGMARVDFFLTPEGRLYVNEINTLPGFTRISMYPKLWEISGLPPRQLVDHLLQLALARGQAENRLQTSFDPNSLE